MTTMTLSSEARRHLDRYLEEMRASMGDADSMEIEQDIRDHIEAELGEHPVPVSADDLDAVLSRLGSPAQWVAPAESGHNRVDDWLAYASAALLLLGFVLPFFLPVSWLLARWTLARLEQRGEHRDARRWLIYPPIAFVSLALVILALLWPFGAFAELGQLAARNRGSAGSDHFPPVAVFAVTFGALGGYWILLGAASALGERLVRFILHPFAEEFQRRHGWWLSSIGAVVAICAAATFFFGAR